MTGGRPTILVTGATGLLGANLVRVLLKGGHGPLRVLVRPGARRTAIEGLPLEIAPGDVEDLDSVTTAARGCVALFHAAGLADAGGAPEERLFAVNVRGTDNVCRAALEAGVRRFVHTSSASALDAAPPGALADESTQSGTLGRGDQPYARSKKRAEEVVLRWVGRGLPAVIVSPTLMFGAWDVKPSSGKAIVAASRGWLPFYPVGGGNVIDVQDAAAGHVAALERGVVGERYVLGHENLSYREILGLIRAALGRTAPFIPIWPGPARAAARLAAPLRGLLPEALRDLASPAAIAASARTHHVSSAKAQRVLGLPQSPVAAAVERAVRWLADHGYIERGG